jgi:alanyl-tRNA synthetase
MVKIVSAIPAKGKIRVSFVCGGRAAKLFRTYMRCADKAGAALSCPIEKLSGAAADLKYRLSEAEKRANRLESREILAQMAAAETAEDLPGATLCVLQIPETDSRAVAAAVSSYIEEKGKALLLAAGERLTFARSADVKIDMNELIKRVGRGGGRPDMASGAGIPECVSVARKILMTEGIGK